MAWTGSSFCLPSHSVQCQVVRMVSVVTSSEGCADFFGRPLSITESKQNLLFDGPVINFCKCTGALLQSKHHERCIPYGMWPLMLLTLTSLDLLIAVADPTSALLFCGITHIHFLFQNLIDYHHQILACQTNQIPPKATPVVDHRITNLFIKILYPPQLRKCCLVAIEFRWEK